MSRREQEESPARRYLQSDSQTGQCFGFCGSSQGNPKPYLGELASLKRHERERPAIKRHVPHCVSVRLAAFAGLSFERQLEPNA
jgi:hypothetical protein